MPFNVRAALLCAGVCTSFGGHAALAQRAALRSPIGVPVQKAPAPRGQAITLGVGVARREPYCGVCTNDVGVSGLVNLSRYVNRAMALGMESTVWLNDAGPVSAALGSAMGTVTLWAV